MAVGIYRVDWLMVVGDQWGPKWWANEVSKHGTASVGRKVALCLAYHFFPEVDWGFVLDFCWVLQVGEGAGSDQRTKSQKGRGTEKKKRSKTVQATFQLTQWYHP